MRSGQLAQRGNGCLRAIFLNKTNDGIEDDNDQNHRGVGEVADHPGNDGRGQQHNDHEVGELSDEHSQRTASPAFDNGVLAVVLQAQGGHLGRQTLCGMGLKRSKNLLRRAVMGRRMLGKSGHSPCRYRISVLTR